MIPRADGLIAPDDVRRVIESLDRIATHIKQAPTGNDSEEVRRGLESHACGIRTAIEIIRADLLHENPWAEDDEAVSA